MKKGFVKFPFNFNIINEHIYKKKLKLKGKTEIERELHVAMKKYYFSAFQKNFSDDFRI